MNPEYEKQLEAAIRRELGTLGELEAPPEIARRVMRVVEQRAATPWYRREWQSWSPALQGVSLVGLLAAFAGLCLGGARLGHLARLSPAGQEVSGWFSLADTIWNAANVLANAIGLAFRNVSPVVVIGAAASWSAGPFHRMAAGSPATEHPLPSL